MYVYIWLYIDVALDYCMYIYIYMYRETAGGDDWNELVSRLVNDHL